MPQNLLQSKRTIPDACPYKGLQSRDPESRDPAIPAFFSNHEIPGLENWPGIVIASPYFSIVTSAGKNAFDNPLYVDEIPAFGRRAAEVWQPTDVHLS
jgi:hypothetical protein